MAVAATLKYERSPTLQDANNQVRRIARSSAPMIEETCRHLCATAVAGQRYLDEVAAGQTTEDPVRTAAVKAALARLRTCVCSS